MRDMPTQEQRGTSEVVTLAQAAQRLGVHEATVRRWVRKGHLPAIQTGPYGRYSVTLADVDAMRRPAA